MKADSFANLWKQVASAQDKDLPQTEISVLRQIERKAETERAWGHLLKAQLMLAQVQWQVSPDSLDVEVARLDGRQQKAADKQPVLAAVYQTALGRIYKENSSLSERHLEVSKAYFDMAMANPDLLAKEKAQNYVPALIDGTDSKTFYNDLLHVVGFEAGRFKELHDYYLAHNNRPAACICICKWYEQQPGEDGTDSRKSKRLQQIDSLINEYGDLTEAGELAIAHYRQIEQDEETTAETKMNYINYALSKWGAWPRMNILRNAQSRLTLPSFHVNLGEEVAVPGKPRRVDILEICNVQTLTMNVYRTSLEGDTELNPQTTEGYQAIKRHVGQKVCSQSRRYIGLPSYMVSRDSMSIDGLAPGVYLVEIVAEAGEMAAERALLRVSDMFAIYEALPDHKVRMVAVSATTGQPLPGAKIRLTTPVRNDNRVTTLTADAKGEVFYTYDSQMARNVFVYTENDKYGKNAPLSAYFNYYDRSDDESILANLFTDRAVYRPGQTVHVAGLIYKMEKDEVMSVEKHKKVKLTLRDANSKAVDEKEVTTDNLGRVSADFTLPSSGLTGRFTVRLTNGANAITNFSVEEYKRPTFAVELTNPKTQYQQGDTVTVNGTAKTFAGVPVQGAKVSYVVTRRPALWWWNRTNRDVNKVMARDTVLTDSNGGFNIPVEMLMPESYDTKRLRYYSFDIEAHVTDMTGETRSAQTALPLSDHPTSFSCDLPNKAERDSLKQIKFMYTNNAGEPVAEVVRYQIDESGKVYEAQTNVVQEFKTGSLKSGLHKLKAVCGTDTLYRDFVVFRVDDKLPPVETHDWFYYTANEFPENGKPVYVQVGSTDDNQHIVYTVLSGNRVVEQGTIDQSKSITTHQFKYKEEYDNGILVTYAWVKEGKLYSHEVEVRRALPDKQLKMKWTTFRDKLTPGQKETWTLHIDNPDGKPAAAGLLATLYDKSLDEIRHHNWYFNPQRYLNLPLTRWGGGYRGVTSLYGEQQLKPLAEKILDFTHFDESIFPALYRINYRIRGAKPMNLAAVATADAKVMMAKSAAAEDDLMNANVPIGAYNVMGNEAGGSEILDEVVTTGTRKPVHADQLRENLNETAFFYPALTADEKGNVTISFTLPESVTTWRFMGLAHDKDMNFGQIEAETVAQKDVMVQPNMPRFLRVADQAAITARISNLSSMKKTGTARMILTDPETQKTVYTQTVPFEVNPGQTSTVTFNYTPDAKTSLLVCKIMAEGKDFQDGEQHYLPVMPDAELVTNTLPFTQNQAGTFTADLKKLFPVVSPDNKLTVEYTNNPAWLMIQSLPFVSNTKDDNAISLASAYYANRLGNFVIKQSDEIKTTIELWRKEKPEESSLKSNLEKNENLKSLLLNETPWVLDAEKESDQKQQLVNFFDENRLEYQKNDILAKLKKLQQPDGSFSWWQGMPGSIYMTTSVANMLVRLNALTGMNKETSDIITGALRFMTLKAHEEVEELKKAEKKGEKSLRPSEMAVDYLYVRALNDKTNKELTASAKSDINYLVGLLKKQTTHLSIYGKAVSAIIFSKLDNTSTTGQKLAKEYLQSIKEYTVYKEEMGRYFDTPKALYSWCDYRIPSQVAAIEALQTLTPDDRQTVSEMQRWLLQAKRTQCWDTPINSVNAIYAFLNGNTDKMVADSYADKTQLKVNGKPLETPKATAGLGYVKASLTGANLSVFEADKSSQHTSWGALYAQFMQKTTDIDDASSGLTVKREIIPVDKAPGNLKVGDRVKVRITITADRDYDFVQVVDKRAACLEPVGQLSGYHYSYYCTPRDNSTNYYFNQLSKGKHVVETEYYIDREGTYNTGLVTVQCAYSPEFSGRTASTTLQVTKQQ